MWMMDNCDNNLPNMNDLFIPTKPNTTTTTPQRKNTASYVGLNHHLSSFGTAETREQSAHEREIDERTQMAGSSSRWNPTEEQLLALEEMYRCGTRTPKTDQIQQIASELSKYGKIEGKNVFYWFQNHKARERQKRRRCQGLQKHEHTHRSMINKKESGYFIRRTVHELDQTKNSVPYSNCSEHVKGLVSVHGPAGIAESRTYEWSEFEEKELQQQKTRSLDMPGTCQAVDFSSSDPPIHHLMTTTTSKFFSFEEHSSVLWKTSSTKRGQDESNLDHDETKEVQTLELFPLRSDNSNGVNCTAMQDRKVPIRTINTNFSASQFFEFLPLKN